MTEGAVHKKKCENDMSSNNYWETERRQRKHTFDTAQHAPVPVFNPKAEQTLEDRVRHGVVEKRGGHMVRSDQLQTLGVVGEVCLQPARDVDLNTGHLQHDRAVRIGRRKSEPPVMVLEGKGFDHPRYAHIVDSGDLTFSVLGRGKSSEN